MSAPIGFKEWQVVCDALASGRQSILLRKGGIHEGRQGFSFAHESFFLFPTRFHTTPDQIREGNAAVLPEWQPGDVIRITHHAEAAWAVTLTDWEKVSALEPLHVYSEQTVRDRFDWEGKGMASGSIHVALVRVRELAEPWEFAYEPKYGGCRSWINLPEPPAGWGESARPVLDDAAFASLLEPVCSVS
ncbi:MAG: DUF1802 family protein [Verrucomicrobiaceae bacterium]|nr:MAG: DUF1802 family protein [Verrucomicrobiaceae bacterium]